MATDSFFVQHGKTCILKTPGAKLLYGWDLARWLEKAGTALDQVDADTVGVTLEEPAYIDGTVLCAWVSGFDLAVGAENHLTWSFTCTDGSVEQRRLHFVLRPM